MFKSCKQQQPFDPQRFISVQLNDIAYFRQNNSKRLQLNKYDDRNTNEQASIFKGFSVLHYACLTNYHQIVKLVINDEILLLTQQNVQFFSKALKQQISLPKGQNCLTIAFLNDSQHCVQLILSNLDANINQLLQLKDKQQNSTFYYISLINSSSSNNILMQNELFKTYINEKILFNLVCAKNFQVFKYITKNYLKECSENDFVKLYRMILSRNDEMHGETLLEVCDQEEKKLYNLIKQLSLDAYQFWLEQDNQNIIKEYTRDKTFGQIFGNIIFQ